MKVINLVIAALLVLLPTTLLADAQLASFTPPDTDISMLYLESIFGVVGNVLAGVGSQIMGVMFGVFNTALLALGGMIGMYTVFMGTLNTAHHGEVLGQKWSSVWIPVRSAAGVGLLLPKTTGYCYIQVFIMWVVVQGVGVADEVWNAALRYLVNGGVIIQSTFQPSVSSTSGAGEKLQAMTQLVVCLEGLQVKLDEKRRNAVIENNQIAMPTVPLLTSVLDLGGLKANKDNKYVVNMPSIPSGPYRNYDGKCGTLSWNTLPAENSPYDDNLWNDRDIRTQHTTHGARTVAVQHLLDSISNAANAIIQNDLADPAYRLPLGNCGGAKKCGYNQAKDWNPNNPKPALLPGSYIPKLYAGYTGIMSPALQRKAEGKLEKWTKEARAIGWIMAASYYYELSRISDTASVTTESTSNFPEAKLKFSKDDFCKSRTPEDFAILPAHTVGQNGCEELKDWIYGDEIKTFLSDSSDKFKMANMGKDKGSDSQVANVSIGNKNVEKMVGMLAGLGKYFSRLLNAQNTNKNPLIILSNMGRAMLDTVTAIWFLGLVFSIAASLLAAAPSFNFGTSIAVLVAWFIPFLTVIMSGLFYSGVMLSYYIPLLPYIIFVFGAFAWLIGVIEAIVAAPIVALGLMHPDGQHDVFGRADQSVMLITGVFLRPALMVIGFIAGISLSYVGVWLLNAGISRSMQFSLDISTTAMWWTPAMAVIYAVTAVGIINKSFALINILPDKVLRWLSGGAADSLGSEAGGEVDQIKGVMSAGAQQMGDVAGRGGGAGVEGGAGGMDASTEGMGGRHGKKMGKSKFYNRDWKEILARDDTPISASIKPRGNNKGGLESDSGNSDTKVDGEMSPDNGDETPPDDGAPPEGK